MSQSNGSCPQFNYNVQQYPYDTRAPQPSNNVLQQWIPSGPRSVQRNRPSPSISVRSPVTAPARSFDCSSFRQPDIAPVNDRIDTNFLGLGYLAPPNHAMRSNYNPIDQNYHEGPWDPYHLRNNDDETSLNQASRGFNSFQNGPGSISSAAPISDSGFYTQSVISHEPGRPDQSCMPTSLTQQVGNLKVRSVTSEVLRMARVHSDQQSQTSHISSQSGNQDRALKCHICGDVSKCKSDYKKHQLKHNKPFMCEEPGCKRISQGFATVNDLDRHRKSVHRIGLFKKSYQCASDSCRNKEKIWPRLDNFKQHIERMHKEEDNDDLIKRCAAKEPRYTPANGNRSIFTLKHPETIPKSVPLVPIDTIIVGMEKSVSSHSNYEPAVETDMRADQGLNRWSTKSNPPHLPLNFYQLSASQVSPSTNGNNVGDSGSQNLLGLQTQLCGESTQVKSNNEPTRITRNAQSEQRLGGERQQKPRPKLSNAPPTKAQQQRQALRKPSQAVSNDMDDSSSSIPVGLEDLIFRILVRTTGIDGERVDQPELEQGSPSSRTQSECMNKISLTKSEAIKATQAISNLIKQNPDSTYSQPRKFNKGISSDPKVCPMCDYAVARPCDLKKHMKRHEKPYGCTYPKCHKRFGAKSDWKRHENSQHFQLEAFRCGQISKDGTRCGEHFFRAEPFKKHLESQHEMDILEEREKEAKRRRIGKNCQHQFWCGFHGDIIELEEKRNAAWDERFDHIAYHFEKDKRSIEEWVCAEENKTKKELLKEMDRYVFDDEDEGGPGAGEAPPVPPLSMPVDVPLPPPSPSLDQVPSPLTTVDVQQTTGNKRGPQGNSLQEAPPKRHRKSYVTNRYCCSCKNPFGTLHIVCMNMSCGHQMCNNCSSEKVGVYA